MNAPCTKCGTPIASPWDYCPQCGVAVTHETQVAGPSPEHEKSSVPGAFGGLLLGVIIAPVLFIFGTMLCLTGLGAFLGIPMIIAAIIAPLAGSLFGIGEQAVRCPSCSTRMITVADSQLHYCPACDQEFALGEHHVARAG